MNLTIDNMLTIGTLVYIKTSKKPMMIIGYLARDNDKEYDYKGCIYPSGVLSTEYDFAFNQEDIDEIITTGYVNEDAESFKNEYLAALKKVNNKKMLQRLSEEMV